MTRLPPGAAVTPEVAGWRSLSFHTVALDDSPMQVGDHMSRIAPPKAVESSPIIQRLESVLTALAPSFSVTFTGPGTRADLIRSPSALEIRPESSCAPAGTVTS